MRRGQRLFPWIPLCSGFPEVPPPTPGSNQCPSLHPTVGAAHPSLLCRLTGNTEDFHWSETVESGLCGTLAWREETCPQNPQVEEWAGQGV